MSPTVGILGAGQLGRMLALAGYPLGLRFKFMDPDRDAPSSHLAESMCSQYTDTDALASFASSVDLITYEFENVPVQAAKLLEVGKAVYPPAVALEVAQDRVVEKTYLRKIGIPTPEFAAIDSVESASAAAESVGLPAVLKTRRMGYDGKGQRVVHTMQELHDAIEELGGAGLILEAFVPFSAECSLISVRSVRGEIRCYSLVENVHRNGILFSSLVPASSAIQALQSDAEAHAARLLTELNYVGVLTIEFFVSGGALIANEIAPRVHNSGHWSIEGAETSQFENHLRSILDLPLGSTRLRGRIGMLNIIGDIPEREDVLSIEGAHLHLYGKAARPNRKVGHITVLAETEPELTEAVERVKHVLAGLKTGR